MASPFCGPSARAPENAHNAAIKLMEMVFICASIKALLSQQTISYGIRRVSTRKKALEEVTRRGVL
jgi:hypothetical protein